MKCDFCGTESEFEAAFIKQRRSFRRSHRTLCPPCWVRRRDRRQIRFLVITVGMGVLGYTLLWLRPDSLLGALLRNLFLLDLFLIASIVPHELGHAVMARMLGWRVFQIVIGVGKPCLKWRWRGIQFDLRWLPLGGITLMAPAGNAWFRVKRFLSVLAGPAVNAGMAAATLWIWQGPVSEWDPITLPTVPQLFVFANLWVLAVNLWPHNAKESLRMPTDGKQLLDSFSRKHLAEALALRFALEATSCRERKDLAGARDWCDRGLALYPDNVHLLSLTGVNHLDLQHYVEAREVFHRLLAREKQASSLASVLMNNIAYANALSGNPEWLAEADAFSRNAYAQLPWIPAIVGTRGTVLLALGQIDEATKLLSKSFEEHESPISKAENACHLAIAHARSEQLDKARRYVDLARQMHPACPLLPRAELEIAGHPATATVPQG